MALRHEITRNEMDDFEFMTGIFPEEIWRIILAAIRDPETLQNLSNASMYFRTELLPRRTEFLFPGVWKVLEPKSTGLVKEQSNQISNEEMQVDCLECGRRRTSRRFSWILNLRLVCKQWNNAVDSLYEHDNIKHDGYNWTKENRFIRGVFHHFISHFAITHSINMASSIKNPFIGRVLGLKIDTTDVDWLLLQTMLTLYGQHVWDCAIFCSNYMCMMFYDRLKVTLDLLPNLKRLELQFSFQLQRNYFEVGNLIRNRPLRDFAVLEQLEMTQGMGALLDEILAKSCNSLKGLEIQYYEPNASVPNVNSLKQISLEYFNSYVSMDLFLQLENVEMCTSSLKILDLTFTNDCRVSVPRIFSMIERQWRGTLIILSLSIHHQENYDQDIQLMCDSSRNLKLKLPNLKKFKLYIDYFMCLDFLYPAKMSLESLELAMLFNATKKGKIKLAVMVAELQKLKIIDHQHKMLESNVWTEFPNLKLVEIEVSTLHNSKYKSSIPDWLFSSGAMQKYSRPVSN